jgi:hypothetical protein
MAVRSVDTFNPYPTTPSSSSSSSTPAPQGLDRPGVVGVDLIGGGAGLFGNVASSGLGTLGEVVNTPWEIVAGEIAQNRLQGAVTIGDASVNQKYIDMVKIHGMSVSDVADQMANDGVAVTGGIAHDLALSIFMDPFNLIAAGGAKAYEVSTRSASIQQRLGDHAVNSILDSSSRSTATSEEVKWLNSGTGRKFLGSWYNTASRNLGGIRKGMAQALFGRSAGVAASAIGIRTLGIIIDAATKFGKEAKIIDAAGIGANHLLLGASADLVVTRAVSEVRASALEKMTIVTKSDGIDDAEAFNKFARYVAGDSASASSTLEDVKNEWEILHKVLKDGKGDENVLVRDIFERDVAGLLNERIGSRGTLPVIRAEAAIEVARTERRINDIKQTAIDEAMYMLSAAGTEAERISLAEVEFIANLEPVIGREAAQFAWKGILEGIPKGKESTLRGLADAIFASQTMRLGSTADGWAAAKASLLSKFETNASSIMALLPSKTRTFIAGARNWTIVAKDTMTNVDHRRIMKYLSDESISVEERALAVAHDVKQYGVLRNTYNGKRFTELAKTEPQRAVDAVIDTLKQYGEDALVQEVPVNSFKGIEQILPEISQMKKAADQGGYKIVFEPQTATMKPNRIYANSVSKDTARFGVDLWVPIVNDKLRIDLGSRNMFGKALDVLSNERRTSTVIANTFTRMQEYAMTNGLDISRNDLRDLHRALTDRGFETKGSIRTAIYEENKDGASGILDAFIARVKESDPVAAKRLLQQRANGDLLRMVLTAAQGDLQKVGLQAAFTSRVKSARGIGYMATMLADKVYPMVKFNLSPLFGIQEVIESKWWNLMRGYNDEKILKIPGIGNTSIKYGTKRNYEFVDFATGKPFTLDAVQVVHEAQMMDRPELKYAQEMNAINMYFSGKTTDAILRFGAEGESFTKGLVAGLTGARNIGTYKTLDHLRFVAAEGLDTMAEQVAASFGKNAPVQWAAWLKMANGDPRGATLLFLQERQQMIKSQATARAVWESNKPLGVGFGRQYDDNPIKNLDISVRELGKKIVSGDPKQRSEAIDQLRLHLSLIHGDAATIGYSDETLKALSDATSALEEAKNGMRLTIDNVIAKKSQKTIDKAYGKVEEARAAMRGEFEKAVGRKKHVRDALIADGISTPLATEMASLFVVAERRREMLPNVSLAVARSVDGTAPLQKEVVNALKDHLIKIRSARVEEESLWNALAYGLESAAKNADSTHFFKTGRNFLERSINHPVFGLYPTSYMFGKVLPEYARMLFLSPQRSVAGIVLAPWQAILKNVSFIKWDPEDWAKFAPLVGFAAATKIRDSMVDGMNNSPYAERNPLIYALTNVLIPGMPNEINVSASATMRSIAGEAGNLVTGQPVDPGKVAFAAGTQLASSIGIKRGLDEATKVVDYVAKGTSDQGGIINLVGDTIGNVVESFGDIITNKIK